MVAERQPLGHRTPGRRHLDSVRHRTDLSAVALRPGVRRLWRLVHPPVDSVGVAGRSRGAGSIRCDRGDGVPRGRGGDDVLAELERGKRKKVGLAMRMEEPINQHEVGSYGGAYGEVTSLASKRS